MRRTILALAAAALMTLALGAAPATADVQGEIDAAVSLFAGGDHVYASQSAGVTLDTAALAASIGQEPVFVAVLSPNSNAPDASTEINKGLGRRATIVVVSGTAVFAGSTVACESALAEQVSTQVAKHQAEIGQTKDVTPLLTELVAAIATAPTEDCDNASSLTSADSDAGSVIPWVLGIGVAVLLVGGLVVLRLLRRNTAHRQDRNTEVVALLDRVHADLDSIDPGSDEIARQALVDAAERFQSADTILDGAETDDDYDAARRAALEATVAAETARELLGLPEGDSVPMIAPAEGEQLVESAEVTVGDQVFRGYPQYTPGAPHFHAGGRGAPGGWYSEPFWESRLIGSMLGGADRWPDESSAPEAAPSGTRE